MKFNLKKVIASVAALAMSLSCFTAFAADFSDVEATASYKNAIDELVALEIVNGYEDGTFKPDNEITRAEVTKMVVAAMGPSYTAAAESSVGASDFTDAKGHWAAGYISVGVAQKFINGMGDGTFAPDANVTYAQIVKMLVAALGYTSAADIAGGYPNGYLQTANQIGVTEGVKGISADTNVTRAQVAQLISNALDTPLVVVTNWTTNYLTGEPVAETKVMDGEEGRSYKTLLTEYHDAYKVKGRVTATHAQNSTKVGEVNFRVENAANYDGEAYKAYTKKEDHDENPATPKVDVLYGTNLVSGAAVGNTDAEALLFTYSEALIKLNADDEATILTITPYGKNDIYTLAAKDYAGAVIGADSTMDFYVAEGSSKTKTYELAAGAQLYVNGVQVTSVTYDEPTDSVDYNDDGDMLDVYTVAPISLANFASYITANRIGTVTLIDSPAVGTTSKDGLIDYIMIDVAKWAIVEAAMVEGEDLVIYLKDFEPGYIDAEIVLDTEDEDLVYSFTKNGAAVEFDSIKEDDVLLVTYDVVRHAASASLSSFVAIDVCDTVVKGQVAGIKTVDGVSVYTIDGGEYKSIAGALTAGNEYTVYLDAAGRIVRFVEEATSANYGVVDRVYRDENTDEFKIRLIKADGTREAYVAKDAAVAEDAAIIAYAAADNDGLLENNEYDHAGTTASLVAATQNRIVTYKVNAAGEVREINVIPNVTAAAVTGDYIANSNKIGSVRMSEATQILDFAEYAVSGAVADIKVGSLSTFIDGESYTVFAGDKSTADNTYRFVIVMTGNARINATTSFAVIDNVSTGLSAEGSQISVLNAYVAGEKDMVALNVDEDVTVPGAVNTHGAVVVLGLDADGTVVEIQGPIYTANNYPAAVAAMWAAPKANDKLGATASTYFLTTFAAWDTTDVTDNNWARAGFGIVLDKIGQTVVMATVNTGTNQSIEGTDTEEFSVADDVNVYVYDYAKKAGARISKGAYGNVTKTFVSDSAITEQPGTGLDIYNWSSVTRTPTYAYYKVTNDEITDILVIKPAV